MYLHRSQKLVYNTKHFISTCKVSELNHLYIPSFLHSSRLCKMWIHFLSCSSSYLFCSSAPGWLGVQSDRAEEAAGGREEAEAERGPCRHRPGGHGNHIRILLGDWSLCVPSLCRWCFTIIFSQPLETWRIWKSWPANPLYLLNLSFTVCRWPEQPIICQFTRVWLRGSDNFPTREDMIYLVSSSTSQQSQLCRRVTSCPRPRTGPGNSSRVRPELAGFWWVELLPLTIT